MFNTNGKVAKAADANLTMEDLEQMINEMKSLYETNENAFFMCSMGLIIFCSYLFPL